MIIIPMAGLSSRFLAAGYDTPKYMLNAHGQSLFWHSVISFKKYFKSEAFMFIFRDVDGTKKFLEAEIKKLGIQTFQLVALDAPTSGQAETVKRGIDIGCVDQEEPITIFNIDTFRPGYSHPPLINLSDCDAYLEVFHGEGEHWSFAKLKDQGSTLVKETAEKRRISDLCSTGLYYFKNATLFEQALEAEKLAPQSHELFIAPLYNHLIRAGLQVHCNLINAENVQFCGTPEEYENFLRIPGSPQ